MTLVPQHRGTSQPDTAATRQRNQGDQRHATAGWSGWNIRHVPVVCDGLHSSLPARPGNGAISATYQRVSDANHPAHAWKHDTLQKQPDTRLPRRPKTHRSKLRDGPVVFRKSLCADLPTGSDSVDTERHTLHTAFRTQNSSPKPHRSPSHSQQRPPSQS